MSHSFSQNEIHEQLINAMQKAGVYPKNNNSLKFNSKLCRFETTEDKQNEYSGWCKIYSDGLPAGCFGDWRKDIKEFWKFDLNGYDKNIRQLYINPENTKQTEARQKEAEIVLKESQMEASLKAQNIYEKAKAANTNHQYLIKKSIKPYGIKQIDNKLLIPFHDILTDSFSTYQTINEDGEKRFFSGAPKRGTAYILGVNLTEGTVLIAEGVATAHTLHELTGLTVIACGDCGNIKASTQSIVAKYEGRQIIIATDNDHLKEKNTGFEASKIALKEGNFKGIIIPEFSSNESGSDWNDYMILHGKEVTKKEILQQINGILSNNKHLNDKSSVKHNKKTNAVILFEHCQEKEVIVFQRIDTSDIYCRFPTHNKFIIDSLESSRFETWLYKENLEITKRELRKSDLTGVLGLLKIKAYEIPPKKIFIRWGWMNNKVYCDLCNNNSQVIEISENGWQVINNSPVWFLKTQTMKSLPVPSKIGSWQDLRPLLNVSEEDYYLIIAWLLSSCFDIPYYILGISSEHGAGKSFLTKLLSMIIDPRLDDLVSPPQNSDDLYAIATSRYLTALNNVSTITPEISDDFCRISDGGSMSKRLLYSNNEIYSITLRHPIIYNGISISPDRPDLLDRTLIIEPLPIKEKARQTETKLLEDFEKEKPKILAALFNAITGVLRNKEYNPLDIGRRADAEVIIRRACRSGAMPYTENDFKQILKVSEKSKAEEALSNSILASEILKIRNRKYNCWQGTANDLIVKISEYLSPYELKYIPQTAKKLYKDLERLAPLLRREGITYEILRSNKQRTIKITFDNTTTLFEEQNPLSILDEKE